MILDRENMGEWLIGLEPEEKLFKILIRNYKIFMRNTSGGFQPKINKLRFTKIQHKWNSQPKPTSLESIHDGINMFAKNADMLFQNPMWQTEIEILPKYLELSILEIWIKDKADRLC